MTYLSGRWKSTVAGSRITVNCSLSVSISSIYYSLFYNQIFSQILYYIYTNTLMVDITEDNVIELLVEAHAFLILPLSTICERYIAGRISEDNLDDIFDLSTSIGVFIIVICITYHLVKTIAKCL